jgi:hypothetical protein
VNGEKAKGLVPPRPNLGPEPWREPDATSRLLLGLGIAVVALVLAAWAWRRRIRRAARVRGGLSAAPTAADPTPRDRLVGLSETIRDALTAQFGVSCRAKTTPELSADVRLAELLGAEGFEELMQFLDRIDLLKFAPERSDHRDEALDEALKAWEPRVTALAARIRARPRARPRNKSARSAPTPPNHITPGVPSSRTAAGALPPGRIGAARAVTPRHPTG